MNTKTINIDLGGATGPPLQNKKQRKRDGSKIEVPLLNSLVREVTYPEISGRGEFPQVEDEVTDTEYVSFGELAKYSMIFDHYNFDSLRFVFYT